MSPILSTQHPSLDSHAEETHRTPSSTCIALAQLSPISLVHSLPQTPLIQQSIIEPTPIFIQYRHEKTSEDKIELIPLQQASFSLTVESEVDII